MLSTEMASKLRSFLMNVFMFYNHPQIHRIPRRVAEKQPPVFGSSVVRLVRLTQKILACQIWVEILSSQVICKRIKTPTIQWPFWGRKWPVGGHDSKPERYSDIMPMKAFSWGTEWWNELMLPVSYLFLWTLTWDMWYIIISILYIIVSIMLLNIF